MVSSASIIRTTGAARCLLFAASAFTMCLSFGWCERDAGRRSGELLQEVDDEEQGDPDGIDEVTVVGDRDRCRLLLLGEPLGGERPADHEQEGDQPADDVQTVEASGDERSEE